MTPNAIQREQPRSPLRLQYLDGLRALAAFYVVLFHAGVGFSTSDMSSWARNLRRVLTFGHDAVAIFIVLSGYCLMLPVARGNGFLVGGAGRYIARRAWRILPPYYVTLCLSLLLLWVVPVLRTSSGTTWDDSSPAFEWGPIASHVLLLHNLFPAWASRINGPLWSVATEWQIYFLFPFLFLPVWRRAGSLATLLVAFAVGCAPIWIAPAVAARWIPWYAGLFALGMCAAGICFSKRGHGVEARLRDQIPWKAVALVLALVCLFGMTALVKVWFRVIPLSDALVGATTAAFLVHYSLVCEAGGVKPLSLRLLESRPLVLLGHFSYSLYLTHLPVVALCYFALRQVSMSPAARMLSLLGLGVPASLVVGYGFFWLVERHFVGRPLAFLERRGREPHAGA